MGAPNHATELLYLMRFIKTFPPATRRALVTGNPGPCFTDMWWFPSLIRCLFVYFTCPLAGTPRTCPRESWR
jgi:hypothetical protein